MIKFAAQFTEDADFVNVLGMHWRGRVKIEARHADLHRTIFRNSHLRMLGSSSRPLAPSVILAHMQWEMSGHEASPGVPFADVRRGALTAVFVERNGRWVIAALHNTDSVPAPLPWRKEAGQS